MRFASAILLGLLLARPAQSYVEVRYTLARIVSESSNIVLMKVDKVNKEKQLILYKKVSDIKGMHDGEDIKHNIGVGGFNDAEKKAPLDWAEPGKLAIFFYQGGASETCIGKYWYQSYGGTAPWWNHSHGEPYLCRSYCGDIDGLKAAVEKLLKKEAVVVPATVSKEDLRIHKYRTTLDNLDEYKIVEHPSIERVKLENVAGFSDMLDLPKPGGKLLGGIALDIDGDGWTDLFLAGTEGLRFLRNNQKGNFDEWTEKWGLGDAPGGGVAFADYNRSGKWSLLTAGGKLYTNTGEKFKDDSALLPENPKRATNPGEAFAWIDFDGDGRPDILSTVGVAGLAAWRNLGGEGKKWFEEVSGKSGLGEEGLGTDPSNYLTTFDLDQDGRADFILNLKRPLVAVNRKGVFAEENNAGLSFPVLGKPGIAAADFRNDGKLGLFASTSDRPGAILDWQMIGTFTEAEDKRIEAGPDFSPKTKPEVKLGPSSWDWQGVTADDGGMLQIKRSGGGPNSAYAYTTFDWPAEEKIALHIGTLDGLTVWLNGKPVYEKKGERPYVADGEKIEVEVKKGVNSLLLKKLDGGNIWKTSVRPSALTLFPPAAVKLYHSDGKGKFSDVTADAGDLAQLRAESVAATWGDIDNDGNLDLLVTCKTGLVRVYLNQGNGKFKYSTAELGLEQRFKAHGTVLADFNNDGKLDLVLMGELPGPCILLMSKIKGKHAPLTVQVADAIGATVTAKDAAGKLLGTRQISGGCGRNLQSAPEARFALPPGKHTIEVLLSSGKTVTREVAVADKPVTLKVAEEKK